MMLRARSIAWASAVKIRKLFQGKAPRTVLFKTAAHTALLLSLDPSVKTEVIGVVLENIVKFLLISAGVGLSFGMFIQFENHFGSFNDPEWCLGKMPSCILFRGIFYSCRVNIIRRPKGLFCLSKCCLYFGLKVES